MSDINTAKEFESHDICIHCNRVQQDKEIDKLQQQNQELGEELDGAIKSRNIWMKENQDLKAFIKEACEVIEFYGDKEGWEVVSPDNQYLECKTIDDSGKRARQFMNTDKYKEYSK